MAVTRDTLVMVRRTGRDTLTATKGSPYTPLQAARVALRLRKTGRYTSVVITRADPSPQPGMEDHHV